MAADACRCLSMPVDGRGTGMYLKKLDADERLIVRKRDPQSDCGSIFRSMDRLLTLITESGLYKLAMRADSFRAKPFQNWVTRDVLPSIRKTGSYTHRPAQEVLQPAAQACQLPALLDQ